MEKITLTIMTPTYNRAYIIDKLYQSLVNQTDTDFQWLVIDDGSTDHTKDFFESIKQKNYDFDIDYLKKENGGKHTCINYALDYAKGKYFFIVDSDDYIPNNAVERIKYWISTIEKESDEKLIGVIGERYYYKTNTIIGNTFSQNGESVDCTYMEKDKYNISGDKAEVIRTDVLKNYKFPVFEGEKFVTEAVVWLELAKDGYKFRWVHEPFYMCEYLDDGLTHNYYEVRKKNPKGYIYYEWKKIYWYGDSIKRKIMSYGVAHSLAKHDKALIQWTKDLFKVNGFTLWCCGMLHNIYRLFHK